MNIFDISLTLLLFLFLLIASFQKPKILRFKYESLTWSPLLKYQLISFAGVLLINVFVIVVHSKTLVEIYIKTSFSLLVLGAGFWISFGKSALFKIGILLVCGVVILLRFLIPSQITHNLFLVVSLFWLGSFLKSLGILTKKRFIVISLIWLLYDIIYVWLTPTAHQVFIASSSIGFPFAFIVGSSSLGSADLLWATCLISVLRHKNIIARTIGLLIVTNILLTLLAQNIKFASIFPLLVVWVPLGLILLWFDH